MLLRVARSWPLVVSASVHVALAALLIGSGGATKESALEADARDIWVGDTLEAADPAGDAPSEKGAGEAEPEKAPEPVAVAKVAPVEAPRAAPRVEKAKPEPPDQDSLAARILAYRPKSGDRDTTSESEPAPGGAARGRTGGMSDLNDNAAARGFAKAFTRALPAANSGDPVWTQLPLGNAGSVRVSVTVDEEGTIAESKIREKPQKPPSHLERLVDRTLILLRGGHFALAKAGAGTETLRIDVILSSLPMEGGPLALGFEAPAPGSPGRAYFQLASGRMVEAKITIEPR